MDGTVDDSAESIAMGSAPYSNETYAYIFWYILAAFIFVLASISWSFRISTILRVRAKRRSVKFPAATAALFSIVSVFRQLSYLQLRVPYLGTSPSMGNMMICALYLIALLSCLLSRIWTDIPVFWEAMALRSGYLAVAQLALLIALSTKKNLIAYITRSSHERLILFHRLIGVCLLVLTTLHMGYFLREWLHYDVWKSEWEEMGVSMLRWGFAAWGILIFIVASSIGFVRCKFYETWIVVHVASMIAFFIMVILHLDPPYRIWAYVAVSIWSLDRIWRVLSRMYLNLDLKGQKLLRGQASVSVMSGGVTKVTIPGFKMARTPGQYAYLSVYSLGINSHPFTITSAPDSPDLIFMMKAKSGLTRSLHKAASSQLPPNDLPMTCSVEGPYGGSHTPFQSFDSVVLIAGGIGSTFTMSLLLDLASNPGCCRRIKYIWVVKSESHVEWFAEDIATSRNLAKQNGIQLSFDVWITCDEQYTSSQNPQDSKLGTCVGSHCKCRSTAADDTEISVAATDAPLLLNEKEPIAEQRYSGTHEVDTCCCSRRTKSETVKEPSYDQFSGRPNLRGLVRKEVQRARGESGIAVCGPPSLTLDVRNLVVGLSDDRAVKMGSGAEAIYLHVENQE